MRDRERTANRGHEPAVVVIGGGTGLSTMLRGLKLYTHDLTAIVTMADDGGGSGVLRQELHMPPPGDIRNCIQALANTEPVMEKLLGYRFTEGSLKGQSLGNLLLAALYETSDSFEDAVRSLSHVLAITGQVLPVTAADVDLAAELMDGSHLFGQSNVGHRPAGGSPIRQLYTVPERVSALPAALDALKRAELIVLGPGSLYTSVIPNLLADGIARAVLESDALRVHILNVMTQPGETEHYTGADHLRTLFRYAGGQAADWCLASSTPIPPEMAERYRREGAEPVRLTETEAEALGVRLEQADITDWSSGFVRHSPERLAAALMALFRREAPTKIY